ncbi:hypothetical protein [Oceanospirillum sediminis]|uniref:Uncharacterized protein n=1 Tax=Oceanospirillum sediminis TaxID=2760088 RepID=A0A839IWA9_9GAMM|nr:hypothetical protein [Oceanospirillum sediminis]MBB1489655.1 hypothetical protein [Oceanospirillum sediminis]
MSNTVGFNIMIFGVAAMQFTEQARFVEHLTQRLTDSRSKLNLLKQHYHLPEHVKRNIAISVVASDASDALARLLAYLLDNPGARTDHISRDCAIGNVSDTHRKKRALLVLDRLGLAVKCRELPACNRFGGLGTIGHLFIITVDNRYEDN